MAMRLTVSLARAFAVVTVTASAAVGLAACSNSGSGGSSDAHHLTIELPSDALSAYATFFLADQEGYFKKYGVDVTLKRNAGVATISDLASDRADLTSYPIGGILPAVQQGLPFKVFASNGYVPTGDGISMVADLVTTPDIKTVADLQKISDCTVSTFQGGTAAYAQAVRFLKELPLPNCKLVTQTSNPLVVATVTSGRAQAAVVADSDARTAAGKNAVNLLISPDQADAVHQFGLAFVPYVFLVGKPDTAEKKSDAMVDLLKALEAASEDLATKPADELVQIFAKDQAFSAEPTDQLTAEVTALKSKYAPGWDGFKITSQQWSDALKQFQDWGIQGYDSSFAGYQFDSLIDNTYVDKAAR